MVQNPIYEGPLYETLDTHRTVNTLATATKNTSLNHTTNTASEETAKSSNSSPTLHYVKQTCVPQSISHAHISPTEGHNTSIQCHASQYSEQGDGNPLNLTVAVPKDMEEKYMIMTQANTEATDMLDHWMDVSWHRIDKKKKH